MLSSPFPTKQEHGFWARPQEIEDAFLSNRLPFNSFTEAHIHDKYEGGTDPGTDF